MNVDAICFSQVVENGLGAIWDLSFNNDANKEAFRCHIGSIMSLLERHGTSTEVMEAGLATVAITMIFFIIIIITIVIIITFLILLYLLLLVIIIIIIMLI